MNDGLSDDQAAIWLAYRRMHIGLMAGLDRQLARDSGMPQGYYAVLATLARQADRRLLLSDLARKCNFSQSRLSHAIARMEESGWVAREVSKTSRRSTYAALTDLGARVQLDAASGHDRAVRELFFDGVTAVQARRLKEICDAVSAHIAAFPKG